MGPQKRPPGDGRLGAGGIPWALSTLAIVLLATAWPKFFSAPWMRVSPHPRFAVAMRTMSDEISLMIPGRPGRFGSNVHFRAISWRCHRRIVSGVTIVATCRKTRRPSRRPFTTRRRRWSAVSRRRRPESCPLRTRFSSTRYDVLLVAIDPPGEGHEQHLQGGEVGYHSPILPCPTTFPRGCLLNPADAQPGAPVGRKERASSAEVWSSQCRHVVDLLDGLPGRSVPFEGSVRDGLLLPGGRPVRDGHPGTLGKLEGVGVGAGCYLGWDKFEFMALAYQPTYREAKSPIASSATAAVRWLPSR
jgi:hypothetical protein